MFDAAGPLGEAILERRIELDFQGSRLWIVSPEELIVLKAFSDRPKDHHDLAATIRVLRGRIDEERILRWGRRLDESLGVDDVGPRLRQAGLVLPGPGDSSDEA